MNNLRVFNFLIHNHLKFVQNIMVRFLSVSISRNNRIENGDNK